MKRDGWLHVYDLGLEEESKYHVMGERKARGNAVFHMPSLPLGVYAMWCVTSSSRLLHASAAVRLHDAMP